MRKLMVSSAVPLQTRRCLLLLLLYDFTARPKSNLPNSIRGEIEDVSVDVSLHLHCSWPYLSDATTAHDCSSKLGVLYLIPISLTEFFNR